MESQQPHAFDAIRDKRHEHPEADAVAMHPHTIRRLRGYAEKHMELVNDDPFRTLVLNGEPDPFRGGRICGWPVLESRDIEEGDVRFVKFLDDS